MNMSDAAEMNGPVGKTRSPSNAPPVDRFGSSEEPVRNADLVLAGRPVNSPAWRRPRVRFCGASVTYNHDEGRECSLGNFTWSVTC